MVQMTGARDGHAHGHGGHVHATVDHLPSDSIHRPVVGVSLDTDLMHALHLHTDDLILLTTDRGRTLLARVLPEDAGLAGRGLVRLDRFGRQSLKAHLNEEVRVERIEPRRLSGLSCGPGADVSPRARPDGAYTLHPDRMPHADSDGAVLYIRFPNSQAGTTYEVAPLKSPPASLDLTRKS